MFKTSGFAFKHPVIDENVVKRQLMQKKLVEKAEIEKLKSDILGDFQTL